MENKNLTYTAININKWGGVKCSPSESDFAHTERPSAHVSVRKVAFLVSALWLTVSTPLFFASCAEKEDALIENTRQTLSKGQSPTVASDSLSSPTSSTDAPIVGEISDWEEGKAGGLEFVGVSENDEDIIK